MVLTLTIGGVAKTIQRGSLSISQTANGRTTASFSVLSAEGSYRPALDAEVIIEDDGTRIFGGLIDRPRERGPLNGAHTAIVTAVSAVDFHAYAERRYVNETLAAGTLKAKLTTLVSTYLAAYGVTLDAGQVVGPSLPALTYEYRQLTDVLNELATLTADAGEPYVWRISPLKVLRLYQPSTTAAPFDILTNTPAQVTGDIEVETHREHYANKIILKVPPKSEAGHVETFTGNGVTSTFTLQYTPTKLYGHILVATGGGETLGVTGDSPVQWTYDTVTNTITRTAGVPPNGEVYTLYFDGVYSGQATASDAAEIAAHGLWERVVTVESVPSNTTAQALADGYLATSIYATQTVKYRTLDAGLAPGQTQTITVPRRNLAATAIITDVVTRDYGKNRLDRTVTAIVDNAKTNLGRGWRDVYKLWAGDQSGGSSATGTGAGSPTKGGPGAPFTAVQFNDSGVFGGDAAFIYYKNQNSIVCGGGGSSITAFLYESCQVFGYDTHIADP